MLNDKWWSSLMKQNDGGSYFRQTTLSITVIFHPLLLQEPKTERRKQGTNDRPHDRDPAIVPVRASFSFNG